MAKVELRDVWKKFGNVEVIKGVSIDLDDGEFVVLVGPSGCGKSTLLNLIAGLETLTSGEIRIGDRVVNDVPPKDRNIAMVFQSYALYPTKTVEENITFGMKTRGVDRAVQDKALAEVAQLLHIEQLLDRKPGQLSGGQRQRVAMGRALVRNPDVFLFDEPLSNLDAKLRIEMRTEVKKLHLRLGKTIVYVTHDQIEALTLSTRIAVMNKGYVQQLGTAKEVYDTPANMFVASFMGSPSMNLLPATLRASNGGLAAELTGSDGGKLLLNLSQDGPNLRAYLDKPVVLGIRPEAITDPEGVDRNAKNTQNLHNMVSVTEPAGSDTFVETTLSGSRCIARMRDDVDVHAGQPFDFVVNMDKAVVFDPASEDRITG